MALNTIILTLHHGYNDIPVNIVAMTESSYHSDKDMVTMTTDYTLYNLYLAVSTTILNDQIYYVFIAGIQYGMWYMLLL